MALLVPVLSIPDIHWFRFPLIPWSLAGVSYIFCFMNWWCCCQVIYIIVRLLRKNFFLRFRCHGLHRRLAKRAQSSLCGKGRVDCVVFLPDQLENFNTPPHSSLDRDWRCATSSRTRPAFSRRSCAVPALFDALLLYEVSLSILLPTTLSAAIYDRIPKYLRRAVISSPGPRGPLNWLPCVERKGSRYIPLCVEFWTCGINTYSHSLVNI